MNTLVSLPIVAAIPTAAPALNPTVASVDVVDPIYAALDEYNRAWNELLAGDRSDRCRLAQDALVRTRPTTPSGLAALTSWARQESKEMRGNTLWNDETIYALSVTIDDATRGMAGLRPWSQPAELAMVAHPDADLMEAVDRYHAALREYGIRLKAWGEVELVEPRPRGYLSRERAYRRAMRLYGEAEIELAKIRPKTLDGLIAKARAIETDFHISEILSESVVKDLLGMAPSREAIPRTQTTPPKDKKLIELEAKLEPLIDRYYIARKAWAASLPEDRRKADDKMYAISNKMRPLERAIEAAPATSIEGLRVKALVAFREIAPLHIHSKLFSFGDAYAFQQLFGSVAEACGLMDKVDATDYYFADYSSDAEIEAQA
jgi:hypothetical protein